MAEPEMVIVKGEPEDKCFLRTDCASSIPEQPQVRVTSTKEIIKTENAYGAPFDNLKSLKKKEEVWIKTENKDYDLDISLEMKDEYVNDEDGYFNISAFNSDIKKEVLDVYGYCLEDTSNEFLNPTNEDFKQNNTSLSISEAQADKSSSRPNRSRKPRSPLYHCSECDYQAKTAKTLKRHVIIVHKSAYQMKLYTDSHKGYVGKTHKYETSPEDALKNHHEVLTCNDCGYETRLKRDLIQHVKCHRNSHRDGETYKCNKCTYQTCLEGDMKRHVEVHDNIPPYNCFYCNYITYEKQKLDAHVQRHNKNNHEGFTLKCPECSFKTVHKVSLRRHLLRHKQGDDVRVHRCDICDYSALQKCNLDRHMFTHARQTSELTYDAAKTLKCPECAYVTFRKDSLQSHLLRHKSRDEVLMHKCDKCGYETIQKSKLTRHKRIHNGNK